MADNYTATQGSGITVAADDVGGVLYPRAKLAFGADGAAADTTTTNPFPASPPLQLIQVTMTVDNGNALDAGDLATGTDTITGAALSSGGATELVSVVIVDKGDNTASAYTLIVTNLSTSYGTIDSAPNIADAGANGIQAIIPIASGDWFDVGNFKVAQPRVAQNIGVICETSGSANLYCVIINGAGTPTFATGDLLVTFGFRQCA